MISTVTPYLEENALQRYYICDLIYVHLYMCYIRVHGGREREVHVMAIRCFKGYRSGIREILYVNASTVLFYINV